MRLSTLFIVIPAKAGIQTAFEKCHPRMDPRFRGDDG